MGSVRRPTGAKALILVAIIVSSVVFLFILMGYLTVVSLSIPLRLGLVVPLRALGMVMLSVGLILFGWLFRYRSPVEIVSSTYVTFSKAWKRTPLEETAGRTENLEFQGPYGYVRHPLYLGIVILLLGWWLLLDYNFLAFATAFLFLWLNSVVAPLEERELVAIFREQYKQYQDDVPKIIPFTKRRRS